MKEFKEFLERNLDGLGRVVVPKQFRYRAGLGKNDLLRIEIWEDGIFIRPALQRCFLCGQEHKEFSKVEGKLLCADCVQKVKAL